LNYTRISKIRYQLSGFAIKINRYKAKKIKNYFLITKREVLISSSLCCINVLINSAPNCNIIQA